MTGKRRSPSRSSGAQRQRRYRRHQVGDHTLCLPSSCDQAAGIRSEAPAGPEPGEQASRGPRGAQLWRDMAETALGPAHRVLLDEACRIADRLDRLDALLAGRENWIRLRPPDRDGAPMVVVVDSVLAESRQQASVLRGLVTELRAATGAKTRLAAPEKPKKKGAGLADLVNLADRRRETSG